MNPILDGVNFNRVQSPKTTLKQPAENIIWQHSAWVTLVNNGTRKKGYDERPKKKRTHFYRVASGLIETNIFCVERGNLNCGMYI